MTPRALRPPPSALRPPPSALRPLQAAGGELFEGEFVRGQKAEGAVLRAARAEAEAEGEGRVRGEL
jgi:hypothetical protein